MKISEVFKNFEEYKRLDHAIGNIKSMAEDIEMVKETNSLEVCVPASVFFLIKNDILNILTEKLREVQEKRDLMEI